MMEGNEPLTAAANGHVAVEMGELVVAAPLAGGGGATRASSSKPRRRKTLLAGALLFVAWVANDVALAYIHERVPRDTPPLPDVWFSVFPEVGWAIKVAEALILFCMLSAVALAIFHQNRWIVLRRLFLIAAVCYAWRALCITIFQVPVPSVNTYCAPKTEGADVGTVAKRVLGLFVSVGIETVRGRVLCGDLIVSGHTIALVLGHLTVRQYSPRRFAALFGWATALAALAGVVCILLARKHYTIDILLAYYIATRVFWMYHALLADARSALGALYWAPLLRYVEQDAPPPSVWTNRFQWPSACPTTIRQKLRHI